MFQIQKSFQNMFIDLNTYESRLIHYVNLNLNLNQSVVEITVQTDF